MRTFAPCFAKSVASPLVYLLIRDYVCRTRQPVTPVTDLLFSNVG